MFSQWVKQRDYLLKFSWIASAVTGSSPLTQAGMADFVPVRAVIVAAKRERVKYEAKCADISPPTEADLKVLHVKTGMVDFVPGRAVIDAAHRKWVKYEAKRANIGYGFLPLFIFFTWGIREGCGEPTEANPKVLRDSRHWSTCWCSYF
ncbi:hypothetical protein Tco_0710383 [Tanacetum coccineum]